MVLVLHRRRDLRSEQPSRSAWVQATLGRAEWSRHSNLQLGQSPICSLHRRGRKELVPGEQGAAQASVRVCVDGPRDQDV